LKASNPRLRSPLLSEKSKRKRRLSQKRQLLAEMIRSKHPRLCLCRVELCDKSRDRQRPLSVTRLSDSPCRNKSCRGRACSRLARATRLSPYLDATNIPLNRPSRRPAAIIRIFRLLTRHLGDSKWRVFRSRSTSKIRSTRELCASANRCQIRTAGRSLRTSTFRCIFRKTGCGN